jgi:4-amino-4-deoxy-L-arabinose transferase-like glycosyltransferase
MIVDNVPEARSVRWGKLTRRTAVGTLLSIHGALLLGNLCLNFIVIDEVAHVPSGISHWQTGSFALDRVNPPLARMLATLPVLLARPDMDYRNFTPSHGIRLEWTVGKDFIAANGARSFDLIRIARLSGVVWSLLGGWLVYRWSRELYGDLGGLLALAVWCFDPTILAFAPVVTPDLPSAVAALLAVRVFLRHLREGSWATATMAGLALGLALLVKHTNILLCGILPVLWTRDRACRPTRGSVATIRKEVVQLFSILCVGLYVLNVGYGFQGTGRSLGGYKFVSQMFRADIHSENRFRGTWLGQVPVPLPEDYFEGIDLQRKDFESALQSYLNGRWSDHGWWYYYLEALALKEPIGFCALGLLGITMVLTRRPGIARLRDELNLLIPAAIFFAVVSSQTGFSHHMRYVMPMYPFLIVSIGKLAYFFRSGHAVTASAVSALLSWAFVGSLAVYPHSLSYFNEIAGGPKSGHSFLLDSNIDWGQDLLYFRDWLRKHPEAHPLKLAYFNAVDPRLFDIEYQLPPLSTEAWLSEFDDFGQKDRYYAISVNLLEGLTFWVPDGNGGGEHINSHHVFDILKCIEPIARAGFSINIYRVTPEQARAWRRDMIRPSGKKPIDSQSDCVEPTRGVAEHSNRNIKIRSTMVRVTFFCRRSYELIRKLNRFIWHTSIPSTLSSRAGRRRPAGYNPVELSRVGTAFALRGD